MGSKPGKEKMTFMGVTMPFSEWSRQTKVYTGIGALLILALIGSKF